MVVVVVVVVLIIMVVVVVMVGMRMIPDNSRARARKPAPAGRLLKRRTKVLLEPSSESSWGSPGGVQRLFGVAAGKALLRGS